MAAASSATLSPAQIVKIPPTAQASKVSEADWVTATIAAILKNTPAPITVPTTIDKAPKKPISFFKSFSI